MVRIAACIAVGVWLFGIISVAEAQEVEADTTFHEVQPGETLFSISQAYEVSIERLQEWNDIEGTAIEAEQELIVSIATDADDPTEAPPDEPAEYDPPVAEEPAAEEPDPPEEDSPEEDPSEEDPSEEDPEEAEPDVPDQAITPGSWPVAEVPAEEVLIDEPIDPMAYGTYTIREGDTFYTVGLRFGVAANRLFELNGEWTDPLPPGRVLRLPEEFSIPTHEVEDTESIFDIAAQYGVSVRALRETNRLADDELIEPGQRLRIPGRGAPSPSADPLWPEVELEGPVAVYPEPFEGRLTASGTTYEPDDFVVSHPDWSFGTLVLITNPETGRRTFARVIDRGPIDDEHIMDVSEAVALQLDLSADHDGGQPVTVRRIE